MIECLNAGDGQWWTGRLRRDPRQVGVFPCNFVQVMPNWQPSSRSPSPLPPSPNAEKPQVQKKSTWRKPFQAYSQAGSPNPDAAARHLKGRDDGLERQASKESR